MFPLGTVLFPGAPLTLQVFEPRYLALLEDCLVGSRRFGVVMIERGSEVGGGDLRSDVGTFATIGSVSPRHGGRFVVSAVGGRRFRVREWLPDSPYPRARVQLWDDTSSGTADDIDALVATTAKLLRRCLGRLTELGQPAAQIDFGLPADPVAASYALSALAPIGTLDRHRLLCEDGPAARVRSLAQLLEELNEDLNTQLGSG